MAPARASLEVKEGIFDVEVGLDFCFVEVERLTR